MNIDIGIPNPITIFNLVKLSLVSECNSGDVSIVYINNTANKVDNIIEIGNLSKLFLILTKVDFMIPTIFIFCPSLS